MKVTMNIPGYTYGTDAAPRSPVTLAEFELMKKSVLFGDEDVKYLCISHAVATRRSSTSGTRSWARTLICSPRSPLTATASHSLTTSARIRKRFGQWILDTARAEYDQKWLDYQHEIGLRHHRTKKNRTDGAASTDIVPFRNLFALVFPVTFTLRPFLSKKGHSAQDVEKMYLAWVKSCLLQVTLWSHPYVKDGDF
jgi:hypothetical protein